VQQVPELQARPTGGAGGDGAPAVTRWGGDSIVARIFRQRELGIIAVGVVLFVVFSVASHGTFDSFQTWGGIASNAAELGIVAVGVGFLMISGEFDLSVGANFAFSALAMAIMIHDGYPPVEALLVDLGIGLGIGLLNGLITVLLNIPSFIATLGTFFLWSAVTLIVTSGETVTILPPTPSLLNVLGGLMGDQIRYEVLWWLGIAIVVGLVLQRTVTGNWIYAIGGRRLAAREAGVAVARTRILAFMLCGMLAAFAGAVQLGHLGSMAAGFGSTYQLEAIAASVVGGCALTGGRGSILGVVVGTIILQMLDSGLILSGVSPYWYEAVVGIIIILAVAMHARIGSLAHGAEG
jgi:simple sugar transport system permease protein